MLIPKRPIALPLLLALLLVFSCGRGRADDPRETPLVKAVRRARSAVVNIHSEKTTYTDSSGFASGTKKGRKINGMGTGIVIDERGYIVTNHHVVNGVDSLRISLDNNASYNAVVVSEDPVRDLAILKIQPATPLTVMPIGISSDLMLGETVFAVGNAFGYEHTVTSGIISSLSRDVEVNDTQSYKNLIQTDAAINPGNSGGPLINVKGEVIGINVAIRAGAQKIGFAIPIDDARKIIAELLKIEYFDGTYHGLVTHDVKTAGERKLVVDSVRPGSPAEAAGFRTGDVILKAGDVSVADGADLERAFLGHAVGEDIRVAVNRERRQEAFSLKLAALAGGPSTGNSNIVVHNDVDPLAQRLWDLMGIRVLKVPRVHPRLVDSKYEGGLQVVSIRSGSPAAISGIKPTDILVGLDRWTTLRMEDVSWVLEHRQTDAPAPVRFHIVRAKETLFGDMQLAQQQQQHSTN
jgi:serine protease Do